MTWWRVVTTFAVGGVRTDDHETIVEAAPIFGKFVGQPLDNLRNWKSTLEVTKLLGHANRPLTIRAKQDLDIGQTEDNSGSH